MVLKSISLILLIIFGVLALYEAVKTYKHFNKYFKEKKTNKVLKADYYKKAKKMYLYYGVIVILIFLYGLLKKY